MPVGNAEEVSTLGIKLQKREHAFHTFHIICITDRELTVYRFHHLKLRNTASFINEKSSSFLA